MAEFSDSLLPVTYCTAAVVDDRCRDPALANVHLPGVADQPCELLHNVNVARWFSVVAWGTISGPRVKAVLLTPPPFIEGVSRQNGRKMNVPLARMSSRSINK